MASPTHAAPFLAAEHFATGWPTLEESRRAHLGKVALQRQSSPSRWLVWSLIAVILIGPLVALFWSGGAPSVSAAAKA